MDTRSNITSIIANEPRPSGTAEEFLNTYMNIWISQFGIPSANVTLFDMEIKTWDHPNTSPSPDGDPPPPSNNMSADFDLITNLSTTKQIDSEYGRSIINIGDNTYELGK